MALCDDIHVTVPAAEPDRTAIPYTLSNGQVDECPAAWSFPRARVFEALDSFARTRRFPETLAWSNDSGDGSQSPNDHGGA